MIPVQPMRQTATPTWRNKAISLELNNLNTACKYFVFISAKLLVLFVGVSFLAALLQEFISKRTIQGVLNRPPKWLGNIWGSLAGSRDFFLLLPHHTHPDGSARQRPPVCRIHVFSYCITSSEPSNFRFAFYPYGLEDYFKFMQR